MYDHILNALKDIEAPFNTNLVDEIVLKDFGGYQMVFVDEKLYQKDISNQYNKFFRKEFSNSLKWPHIIWNFFILALCLITYYTFKSTYFNVKVILVSVLVCFFAIAIFGFSKILLNKYKYLKYSVLDNYLGYACLFGLIISNWLMGSFISKRSLFEISIEAKLIMTLCLFFFASVYVRAFIKFYNRKLKVLGI